MMATPRVTKKITMPGSSVCAEFQLIDSAKAEELLKTNTTNRTVRQMAVKAYKRDMEQGEWIEPSVIHKNIEGKIVNGQHSLMAVIESGRPQFFLVLSGLPMEAQDVIDTGRTRAFGDQLAIKGEANAKTLAAAVRIIWCYENFGALFAYNTSPTHMELSRTLKTRPEIRDYLVNSPCRGLPASLMSGFFYLSSQASIEDGRFFLERLRTGDGMENEGDPILALRERLIRAATTRSSQIDSRARSFFVVRSWNAWRAGVPLHKLIFTAGGSRPDRMPLIDGCSIVPRSHEEQDD